MKLSIERGLEIPDIDNGRPSMYPFEDMSVGDSFFVPVRKGRKIQSLRTTLYTISKRKGVKISMRTIKKPKHGLRVWRTE